MTAVIECRRHDAGKRQRIGPHEVGLGVVAQRARRVDLQLYDVALQNAVRCAARVVARTFVVQHRHLLGWTFAVAQAQAQGVRLVVGRLLELAERLELVQVDHVLLDHQHMVAAAVDRAARFEQQQPVAAGGVGVLQHAQPAHDAGAVQALVVQAQRFFEVGLLVNQVARHDAFAPEPVVLQQRTRRAFGAGRCGFVVVHCRLLQMAKLGVDAKVARACGRIPQRRAGANSGGAHFWRRTTGHAKHSVKA